MSNDTMKPGESPSGGDGRKTDSPSAPNGSPTRDLIPAELAAAKELLLADVRAHLVECFEPGFRGNIIVTQREIVQAIDNAQDERDRLAADVQRLTAGRDEAREILAEFLSCAKPRDGRSSAMEATWERARALLARRSRRLPRSQATGEGDAEMIVMVAKVELEAPR